VVPEKMGAFNFTANNYFYNFVNENQEKATCFLSILPYSIMKDKNYQPIGWILGINFLKSF